MEILTSIELVAGGKMPKKATHLANGWDVFARLETPLLLFPREVKMIPLGVKLAVPSEAVLLLLARSGLGCRGIRLNNGVGVIDADYRGEITACLYNASSDPITIHPGMAIAQLLFVTTPVPVFEQVSKLPETKRGEGGFGSTG